jgi:hypothetical protein
MLQKMYTSKVPARLDAHVIHHIRLKANKSKELGDCYIFKEVNIGKNPEPVSQLLKIGFAEDVRRRIDELEKAYGVDLEDVECGDAAIRKGVKMTPYYRKLEKLVHAELYNFRYKRPGKTLSPAGTTEWFLVDTQEAIRVLHRWREFLRQDPYDESGQLKKEWKARLKGFDNALYPIGEKIDDHDKRNKRWDKFVNGEEELATELPEGEQATSTTSSGDPPSSPESPSISAVQRKAKLAEAQNKDDALTYRPKKKS